MKQTSWLWIVAAIILTCVFVMQEKSAPPDRVLLAQQIARTQLAGYNAQHRTAHAHPVVQVADVERGTVATLNFGVLTLDTTFVIQASEDEMRERIAHELGHYVVGLEQRRASLHADDGSIEFQKAKDDLLAEVPNE